MVRDEQELANFSYIFLDYKNKNAEMRNTCSKTGLTKDK